MKTLMVVLVMAGCSIGQGYYDQVFVWCDTTIKSFETVFEKAGRENDICQTLFEKQVNLIEAYSNLMAFAAKTKDTRYVVSALDTYGATLASERATVKLMYLEMTGAEYPQSILDRTAMLIDDISEHMRLIGNQP